MKRIASAILALLAAGTARSEDVAGFIHGGVGVAFRKPDAPYDYDAGTVLHLEVGNRYPDGLMVRVSYAYTFYDALTGAGGVIARDIGQQDARFGLFFAPQPRGALGFRVGGGYVYGDERTGSSDRTQDGGFLEAAATLDAGRRATFDLAAAVLKVEGRSDYDAEGGELRLGVALHAGPVDLTLGSRYLALDRESPFDESLLEFRAGVAGRWGYAENY